MPQLTKKERYWLSHLTAWRDSGVSITEYTRQHKLTPSGFYEWRKRLAPYLGDKTTMADSLFVPVELDVSNQSLQALMIYFPNGCRVELPSQHTGLLKQILSFADAQ